MLVANLALSMKQTRESYDELEDCKNVIELISNHAIIDKNIGQMKLALESMNDEEETEVDGDNMETALPPHYLLTFLLSLTNTESEASPNQQSDDEMSMLVYGMSAQEHSLG